ncbi:hypothetical protein BECAL_01096 [Bellilinea caldifistulae]|uniref:DUF2846 domain-containing protein n=1 Tax=Bellilinea caldifistulae TaxID=360411 RepID=A0A0P6XDA4_9CHLR|nr:hypothetical protein [Bellilinea caldifistulae]KPL77721.1 hypothetical protein AC812_02405 [Bellilinea caldifistulae]GAP09942.1 hypothetical protein BECAL_01096 [Bellilinea caldifistulae]
MKPFAKVVSLMVLLALFFGFAVSPVQAQTKGDQCETFFVNVNHGINGTRLGLSRELPVVAYVYKDGDVLAKIPLVFKDNFQAELPVGEYTIEIFSEELGVFIDSMKVGPVEIPGCVKVTLLARLGEKGEPTIRVLIRELAGKTASR